MGVDRIGERGADAVTAIAGPPGSPGEPRPTRRGSRDVGRRARRRWEFPNARKEAIEGGLLLPHGLALGACSLACTLDVRINGHEYR